ncbi:MAG: phosphotransferase family protein [Acidimicrobiia bacterium]
METPEGAEGASGPELHAFLAEHGFPDAQLTRISGGRSNLTYLVDTATKRAVLRRPPLGHVLATAHDMGREARILWALAPTSVPVPQCLAYCDDRSVIGAPFTLMSFVDGRILREPQDITALSNDECTAITTSLIEVLATLHTLDPLELGLEDFGRPVGYLQRQVTRWSQQLDASRTRPVPDLDATTKLLLAHVTEVVNARHSVVHGDYRLDNTVIDPHGIVCGVLDWEMSTLGDPLTDLALLCCYSGEVAARVVPAAAAIAAQPRLLDQNGILTAYAARTGAALEQFAFYEAFAHYKLAIIAEGIHTRYTMGLTVGDGFAQVGDAVPELAAAARKLAVAAQRQH